MAKSIQPVWRFAPVPDDQVMPDVTQRDQFTNDTVVLDEALVREATQNSSDGRLSQDKPVLIRMQIRDLNAPDSRQLAALLAPIDRHCEICGLETDVLSSEKARILLVEDFGTTGLTGAVDSHDDGNFAGFWRRHGGSNKQAGKQGSHGLGKLVFSASSALGVIFGYTVRHDDGRALLLGQAVLNNHRLDGKRLPPHGYWSPTTEPGKIQLPSEDSSFIAEMTALFGFTRKKEPGFSVAVPYPGADITAERLQSALIKNYFFPVLSGDLEADINGLMISRTTFDDAVSKVGNLTDDDRRRLQFARELTELRRKETPLKAAATPGGRPDETSLTAEELEKLRADFSAGKIISIRHPVRVTPKKGAAADTFIDLYLKKKPDDAAPWALFARDAIVLPGEAFSEAAFGALIASDPAACSLLRDAENPAHTKWDAHERVRKNWKSGAEKVRDIRLSLKAFYRLITAELREELPDLLTHLLSVKDPLAAKRKNAPKRTPKPPPVLPPPRPKFYSESRIEGGFRIMPGPGAADREFPVMLKVRVAYDTLNGNPFKLHNALDFDLVRRTGDMAVRDLVVSGIEAGSVLLECLGPDFRFEMTGFDTNRDLIVETRIVG
jgi:hypothetical protein